MSEMVKKKKPVGGRDPRVPFDHDPEKEYKLSDYRDKLTLDEVVENDNSMMLETIRNTNRHFFSSIEQAKAFSYDCLRTAIEHLGCLFNYNIDVNTLQKNLDDKKIIVESRKKDNTGSSFYKGENVWRNGLYIYKAGELIYFISFPIVSNQFFAINRSVKFFVVTNVKNVLY